MNATRWPIGFPLLLISTVCFAGETELPGSTGVVTSFPAPEPGRPLTIILGAEEAIPFIWIASMNMWVGQFEISNGQYRRFDVEHESQRYYGFHLNDRNQPVVSVSWEDARNYCSWLNRNFSNQIPPGYFCRLPTEKEWETFAACGNNRAFPWGNQWPPPDGWNYRGEETSRGVFRLLKRTDVIKGHRDKFIVACPVDQSGTNEWSLYGVGGNVWEWCQDWFDTNDASRVLRGASWSNYQQGIIALTNRTDGYPQGTNAMIGLRVVIGK